MNENEKKLLQNCIVMLYEAEEEEKEDAIEACAKRQAVCIALNCLLLGYTKEQFDKLLRE